MSLIIVYHGTDEEGSGKILKEGFSKGTWFAAHLEDAIEFGGSYVFEVVFNRELIGWQEVIEVGVPVSRVVSLSKHVVSRIYSDEDLRTKVFEEIAR